MLKKRVGRVEAIIIMKAAKEFQAKQAAMVQVIPEPVTVAVIVDSSVPAKKTFFSRLITFFSR